MRHSPPPDKDVWNKDAHVAHMQTGALMYQRQV